MTNQVNNQENNQENNRRNNQRNNKRNNKDVQEELKNIKNPQVGSSSNTINEKLSMKSKTKGVLRLIGNAAMVPFEFMTATVVRERGVGYGRTA